MLAINLDILTGFLLDFLVQFGVIISILFIATKGRRFITQFSPNNNLYQGNMAVVISSIGFYISLIIIINTGIQGESFGYIYDMIIISSLIFFGLLFLAINRLIVNFFYFKELNPEHELGRENIAFAIFQAGGFLATSIIFYKSFAGFELNLGLIYVGTLYFFITQISIFVVVKLFILKTPYDDIREIQKGNIAVSIEFLSLFISVALLFGNVTQAVVDINIVSVATLFTYFIISSIFIIYLPTLLTSVLTSGNKRVDSSIGDGNILVAIKSAVIKIVIAIVIVETLPLNIVIIM